MSRVPCSANWCERINFYVLSLAARQQHQPKTTRGRAQRSGSTSFGVRRLALCSCSPTSARQLRREQRCRRETGFLGRSFLTSGASLMRSGDARRRFGKFSMLGDIGRREADGNRDNSGASHDPTLQCLVANAGAFLYGHVVRSGKQKVWCLDGYQLQGRIGTGK